MNSLVREKVKRWIWFGVCLTGATAFFVISNVYGAEDQWESKVQREPLWEEDYTDTGIEKGMLAIRTKVFQGFHGTVRIVVIQVERNQEYPVFLTMDNDYIQNLMLPPGVYCLGFMEAISENRQFTCISHAKEFSVNTNEVTVCQIMVDPSSCTLFPEELATTPSEIEQEETQWTESLVDSNVFQKGETGEPLPDASAETKKTRNGGFLLTSGFLGIVGFASWFIWLWKRR